MRAGVRYQPGPLVIIVMALIGMVWIVLALTWLTLRLGCRGGLWLLRRPGRYTARYAWIGQHRASNHLEGNGP